jgi:hypothetical protein
VMVSRSIGTPVGGSGLSHHRWAVEGRPVTDTSSCARYTKALPEQGVSPSVPQSTSAGLTEGVRQCPSPPSKSSCAPTHTAERTETLAVAVFLAGYCGSTRTSYATDLRLFATSCHEGNLTLFGARRAHLELFGRWMEECGRMRSTVVRRLSTWPASTATASRSSWWSATRPSTCADPRSTTSPAPWAWTATSSVPSWSQASPASPRDHALASLLALNGLRISEALGGDIEHFDFERGHRTLKVLRKGCKHATVPLAPLTSRVLDLYIGERRSGPIFVGAKGRAHGPLRRRPHREAPDPEGGDRQAHQPPQPAPLLHHRRPRRRRAPFETSRRRPATPIRAPRCATTRAEGPSTATPPTTSWLLFSLAPRSESARRYWAPVTLPPAG